MFLPGESHGQRSLAGCSPWCHRESDTTAVSEDSTALLYNSYCKLVWPWLRYNHQRDAFDKDEVADKLLNTMLNCLLLLRSGKLLF